MITWSYKQWAEKIKANFDTYFYVNEKPTEGELKPELIHRRGIYKDTHGASQPWADYQLRPNFPVAMVAVSITHILTYFFENIHFSTRFLHVEFLVFIL